MAEKRKLDGGVPAAKRAKTVAKQRYLKKKADKRKKLVAAKKASAPKNKHYQPELDGKDGNGSETSSEAGPSRVVEPIVAVPELVAQVKTDNSVKKDKRRMDEQQDVTEKADRKEKKRKKQKEADGKGKGKEKAAEDAEEEPNSETERIQRKAEKKAKREARDPERRKAKRAAREAAPKTSPLPQPTSAEATAEAVHGEAEGEGEPIVNGDNHNNESAGTPARSPSPAPIEPFPLPVGAPAPDPALLQKQGLPAGLAEARFVDQDLRAPLQGLSEDMVERLKGLGVEDFFAVQAAILPELLPLPLVPLPQTTLSDYLISAPTGSGKTLAYAVPLIHILASRTVIRLRALVVLPTKDLVVQVKEVLEALAKGTGLIIGSCSGQRSLQKDQEALVAERDDFLLGGSSKVDILVTTPGKLIDHLKQTKNFTLQHLRFLVIDEADRLLTQSFQNWLAIVLSNTRPPLEPIKLPENFAKQPWDQVAPAWQEAYGIKTRTALWDLAPESHCQKLLFSATLTSNPALIASLNLSQPHYVVVQSESHPKNHAAIGESFALPSSLVERMLILPPEVKPLNLIHLIHHPEYAVRGLVFCKSVESASRLVKLLQLFEEAYKGKIVVKAYSSDQKPADRKRLLADFTAGKVHLLVCSDIVARGMDLPACPAVVSYDVPLDMRKYVHRVGRTARAGRAGTAWTMVEKQEALHFKSVLKGAGREKMVKKVKIKPEDLEGYKAAYEVAVASLKEFYGRD